MPFSDLDRIDITYFLIAKVGENFVVTIKWLRVKMKKILTKCLTNDKMIKNNLLSLSDSGGQTGYL